MSEIFYKILNLAIMPTLLGMLFDHFRPYGFGD